MRSRTSTTSLKVFSEETSAESCSRINPKALTDACWLRTQVLSSGVERIAAEVPAPLLASDNLKHNCLVRDYVLWWIRHPAAGSDFAAKTAWIRWLPDAVLLRVMTSLAYDGIIYAQGNMILGHVFFQRRSESVFGFSTAVDPRVNGQGYSVVMILDYLAYISRLPGIIRARVGRGQNNVTSRLLARLKARETFLGWQVDADGWVTFAPSKAEQLKRCA